MNKTDELKNNSKLTADKIVENVNSFRRGEITAEEGIQMTFNLIDRFIGKKA